MKISISAKEKAHRMFGVSELQMRVKELKGTLYYEELTGRYILRTQRGDSANGRLNGRINIIFVIEDGEVEIIAQRHDHSKNPEYDENATAIHQVENLEELL